VVLWLGLADLVRAQNITGISPQFGGPGTVVTNFGSNLQNTTAAYFGSLDAPAVINSVSPNQVVVTVPTNAVTGNISLIVNSFTVNSPVFFFPAPRVTSFTPRAAVGQQVQINGENFGFGSFTVRFGAGTTAAATPTSSQTLFVNVPSGALSGPLTVTVNLSGNLMSATTATNFAVSDGSPVITGFTPSSGLPGTQVLVEGGDFTGATAVKLNGTNLAAGQFTVTAPTQLYFNVPANGSTGPISVTTSFGTGSSTSNFVVSGAPIVTSFTPSGGPTGSLVVVTGQRFIGATNVLFNGAATTNFHVTADTQIDVVVPTNATTGPISVRNAFGTGASAASFTVGSAPAIASFFPLGGPAGTQVTINGTHFNNITAVRFNGSNASFTITGAGVQLVATVPASAGTGPVSVETPFGTNTTSSNFFFGSAPTITGFTPSAGPTNTAVTISGNNFISGNTVVKFNGVTSSNATVTAQNQINAPVPFGATTGPVTVETPIGTNTTSSNFFVTPRIDGFNPTNGAAGGNVLITGLNFLGASAVRFNGVDASFQVHSNSGLIAQVPTNTLTGPISVLTPAGIVTTTTNFSIAPRVFGFTPAAAPEGAVVTISGAALSTPIAVRFNTTDATAVVLDSVTQVRAVVPAGASSGPLRVTTPDGQALAPENFIVKPAITSISPTNGGFGTVVTINGTTLGAVTAVKFNGVNAPFTLVNSTRVTATVPAGATTGPIEVFTADSSASSSQVFLVGTAVLGFSPVTGAPGDTVRVQGVGLDSVTLVEFNGAGTTQFSITDSNNFTVTVPLAATTGPLRVVAPTGGFQTSSNFTVLPVITSFGPTSGGYTDEVTINGGGFGGVTGVQFNGEAATFTVVSATQIRATVPAAASSGPLRVTTASGTALSGTSFSVVPPTLIGFNPLTGTVGSSVVISGLTLAGATNVTFNGVPASGFTVNSTVQISAIVPASASFGQIRVFTPAGAAVSTDNFGVQPVVTGISPTNGAVGSLVTITGNGFLGVTNVQFSGVSAAQFEVSHAGQITAQVPSVASPGKVRVQSPGGFSESEQDFTPLLPVVSGFSPVQGGFGTPVTITGTNLSGTTAVQFNGVNATLNTITATQVVATVPFTATTGPITVVSLAGALTTSSNFTVLPVITSFTPPDGFEGDTVSITGTLFTGATEVRFGGGTTTQFSVVSSNQITATIPATATSGPIQVVTPAGTATSTGSFTVFPALVTFVPDRGPVGTVVDLRGVNLVGASSVLFNLQPVVFTNLSSTNIAAVIPAGAVSGTFRVTTPQGNVETAQPFLVTPRIDAFSPRGGLPGDTVLLIGSAFTGATNVLFNTNQPASFVVSNYSVIAATVPAGATNGPVTVRTPAGEGVSAFDFPVGAALLVNPTNSATQLAIAWSTNATGYVLEYTFDLTPPINWQPVTEPPVLQDGRQTVILNLTSPPRYFRLRR